MKYITFALALLGVVGSIKLDQVPHTPSVNTMTLLRQQAGDPGKAVADAIEASPKKSLTRKDLAKVLRKYFKKAGEKKTPAEIKKMVEWVFSKTDAHGDKDGRVDKKELEILTSQEEKDDGEDSHDDHDEHDDEDNGRVILKTLHDALEADSDKMLTREETEAVAKKFAKEHGMKVTDEQVKGFVDELFKHAGVKDGESLTKEHLEKMTKGHEHGDDHSDDDHSDDDHSDDDSDDHNDDGPSDEQKREIASALRKALKKSKSGTLNVEQCLAALEAYVKSKGINVPKDALKQTTQDIFDMLDADKDGKVTKKELEKVAKMVSK